MNLRILKKLSKQAAEILAEHYTKEIPPIFMAKRGENYHGLNVRCPHKPGRFHCSCTYHPLKGTPMLGQVSGYYEPEWDEETTWSRLGQLIEWGDKPATMTDDDWAAAQRVARSRPITRAELEEWLREPEGAAA